MPEYFLDQAGITSEKDFSGAPGYSGSHDKTVDLVQAGTYEGGALNVQVWKTRKEKGTVDTTKVDRGAAPRRPTATTTGWPVPKTNERFGTGFTEKVKAAMLAPRLRQRRQRQDPRPLRREEVHRHEGRQLQRDRVRSAASSTSSRDGGRRRSLRGVRVDFGAHTALDRTSISMCTPASGSRSSAPAARARRRCSASATARSLPTEGTVDGARA